MATSAHQAPAGGSIGSSLWNSLWNSVSTTETSTMGQGTSTTSADTLREELSKSIQCSANDSKYIPADALDRLITIESVLGSARPYLGKCPNVDAKMIVEQAKKTFVILVLSGCENIIYNLVVIGGMADHHLPLCRQSCTDVMLGDGPEEKNFRLETLPNASCFDALQSLTLAPIFRCSTEPLVLQPKQPLPFRSWEEIAVQGGYGCVYKSALHPAHFIDDSGSIPAHPAAEPRFLDVAIKKFHRICDFKHEYDNLTKTRALGNPHLIRHMAAYEIPANDSTAGSKYYIIFPWADGGHLQELWRERSKAPRTPELIVWSLKQMLGIATAIRDLHHRLPGNTNCRHGDLKPQNIFHFKDPARGAAATHDNEENPEGLGILVIGDLGISRIHDKATYERDKMTGTNATTPDYEPPEALNIVRRNSRGDADQDGGNGEGQNGKPWSRKYDMWSLGCIFLEFAIWLFRDRALENFSSRRERRAFYVDDGDVPHPESLAEAARVCPTVKKAMDALREDERGRNETTATAPGPLRRLLDLIDDRLLVINANARCDANELVDQLRDIVEAAEADPAGQFQGIVSKSPAIFAARRGSGH